MFRNYKWFRWMCGGHWYYLRPYDNLDFSEYMRYWTLRKPCQNEVVLKEENYEKGGNDKWKLKN